MIEQSELSENRHIDTARRPGAAGRHGVRTAAALAALGAAALWPVITQPAGAALPVRQAMAPPARAALPHIGAVHAGLPHAGPLHAGPATAGFLLGGPTGAAPADFAGDAAPDEEATSAEDVTPAVAALASGALPGGVAAVEESAVRGVASLGSPAVRGVPARSPAPSLATTALGPAGLAAGSVWDHIAMCESSGDWHVNTGNGFFGGLQFWQPTWREFGGGAYARRADLATRGQQITIAQSVLRAQGWQAWPVCSRRLGLHGAAPTAASAAPGTSTGGTAGSSAGRHTVAGGETLTGIAQRYHVDGGWQRLYAANKAAVGADPDRLLAGTVLVLP